MATALIPVHVNGQGPASVGTVTLKLLVSPLRGADGQLRVLTSRVSAGQTVEQALPEGEWLRVIWNGRCLSEEEQASRMLEDGDEVLAIPQWGIFVGGIIGALLTTFIVGLAVSVAASYLNYLLFPPAKPHIQAGLDEPTFSFEGIRTAVGPGQVVPVIYGRHRVGGQLLSSHVDQALTVIDDGTTVRRVEAIATSPTLSMLLAIGEGPINGFLLNTIEINGQPIANFPTVQIDTRLGTPNQTPMAAFGEIANTFADGREIAGDPGITYTTTDEVQAFALNVSFQQGLFVLTERGEKHENTSTFGYQYRVSPGGTWSDFSYFEAAAARTSVVRFGIRKENLPLARYDIHLQWSHARNIDDVRAKWIPTLDSVTEILANTQAYPNTALLGLRSVATDALQGALPNITVEVQGKLVRIGTFVQTLQFTDNPAWCVMDLITHPRYGLNYPDSQIDLQAFSTWGGYCDEVIEGEVRHRLNYVLDRELRAQPALLEICAGSRTLLLKSEGLWTPRPTRDQTPVQLLSSANVTNLKLTYSRDQERVNVVEARFINEEEGFDSDVLTWPRLENWPAEVRKTSLDMRGVTKPSRIMRALQFELNRRRLELLTIEMDCALEAVVLQPHDLFRFSHPLPGWGTSGRLQPGSNTSFLVLDEPVTFLSGQNYHVYVRHEDDTVEVKPVSLPVPGTYMTVGLAVPLSQTPVPYTSVWAFGMSSPADTAVKIFRVVQMQYKSDTTVHIQAVVHNPAIYDEPTASPLPVITTLFNPLGPSPPITSLVLTEVTRIQADGTSLRVVNLSWDVAPLSPGYGPYGGALILRRLVLDSTLAGMAGAGATQFGAIQNPGDPNFNFIPLVQVRGHVLDWDDFTVITGSTYLYRVVPISQRAVPNNIGAREGLIHVSGPTTPDYFPGQVRGLRLKGQPIGVTQFEGRDVHLEWDPVEGTLFTNTFFITDYLVEVWAPLQEYRLRQSTVPARGPGETLEFTYTLEQNTEDHARVGKVGAGRDLMFIVWARTNTNRISLDPSSITVHNPPPDMGDIIPHVDTLFQAALIAWDQFFEPRDFDHYEIHLDTIDPPIAIYLDWSSPFTGVGSSFRKIAPQNLTPGLTYYVYILPYDTFGPGIQSHTTSFVPAALTADAIDTVPPAMPTGLLLTTGTSISDDGTIIPWVQAAWNANAEADMAGYEIHFRVAPSTTPTVFSVDATQHSVRLLSVAGNVTVFAKLLAYDKFHNTSGFTAEVSITTASDTLAPAAPTNLTAVGSVQGINLLWTPPVDLDYDYAEVWSATTNDRALATPIGQGAYSFSHRSLGPNDTRYYWVRAVDTSGNLSLNYYPIAPTAGISATAGQLDTTYISSLAADKIIAGTIQALVSLGVNNILLDGVNSQIVIKDQQASPVTRVILGKLGALSTDWGLRIFGASGQLMWNLTDGAQTAGIADNAITGTKITAATIASQHLRTDTAVITTAAQIANALIGFAHIQTGAIHTAHIADAQILSAKIGFGEIQTANLGNAIIGGAHIQNATINSGHIINGVINTAHIGNAQIISAHIGSAQITSAHIGTAQIQAAHIQDLSVGTLKLADGSVLTGKIGLGAVSESVAFSTSSQTVSNGPENVISILTFPTLEAGDIVDFIATGIATGPAGDVLQMRIRRTATTETLGSMLQHFPATTSAESVVIQAVYNVPFTGGPWDFSLSVQRAGGTGTVGLESVVYRAIRYRR